MKLNRLAALGAVAIFVAACGAGGATVAPTVAPTPTAAPSPTPGIAAPTSLITAGTLTDCVDIEYSPMEYFPAGETDVTKSIGFDVDSARAVADLLGLQLVIKNTAFDSLIPDLQAKRCDIVWTALYVSEKRLAVADAVPYMATGQVIMTTTANAATVKSLDDLCGKNVAFQSGGLVEQRITAQSTACTTAGKAAIGLQGYKTVAEEFQQIVKGSVDAIWETDTAVSDWMIKNPGAYALAFGLPKDDNYGVYYTKGAADLGAALTAAIAALKADGSLADIAATYQIDAATLDVVVK